MVSLRRLVLEYDNGKKYALEGDELKIFLEAHDIGIQCVYIHSFMGDLTDYMKLMEKILREVGGDAMVEAYRG